MNPAVESLAKNLSAAHAKLLADVGVVEKLITQADAATLRSRLEQLRADLTEHFRLEEHGGYLESVRARDPNAGPAIAKLHEEHVTLAKSLDKLVRDAASGHSAHAMRDGVMAWIGRLRRHEFQENTMAQDAFNVDVSGED